jgi:hypothetical protein
MMKTDWRRWREEIVRAAGEIAFQAGDASVEKNIFFRLELSE